MRALLVLVSLFASTLASAGCHVTVRGIDAHYGYVVTAKNGNLLSRCLNTAVREKIRNPEALVRYVFENGHGYTVRGTVDAEGLTSESGVSDPAEYFRD